MNNKMKPRYCIDDVVYVSDNNDNKHYTVKGHYAGMTVCGKPIIWAIGKNSHTVNPSDPKLVFNYIWE